MKIRNELGRAFRSTELDRAGYLRRSAGVSPALLSLRRHVIRPFDIIIFVFPTSEDVRPSLCTQDDYALASPI
jgi:hypothetical protein